MSKFSSIYKQTVPTRRTVNGENTYEKGMMWSNQALMPGYTRTLLNFEVDTLTGALTVPGGFHTTDIAAGCTFIDNAVFDSGTGVEGQVIVLQGRNEYCLRAFEGITNIIGVQRLSIKNNQTLAERLRQQGFTADDVTCYKILTYNPINHRLMSVTLIKAARDKYFTLDEEFFLRRLNVNPISCGFSEVWDNADDSIYVSNKLDYHSEGAEDSFIPRVRRNKLDETFNQALHSPLHMQTVPHCEGFGNKTFVFTKKKQVDLAGPIVNQTPVTFTDVYHVSGFSTYNAAYQTGATSLEDARKWRGNWGHAVNDIINIYTTTAGDNIENLQIKVLSVVTVQYYVDGVLTYTIPGVINSAQFLSTGTFKWTPPSPHTSWEFSTTGSGGMAGIGVSSYTLGQIVNIGAPEMASNYQYDTYFGNMHTGLLVKKAPTIGSIPVPVDAYRFGIALTSLGIKSSLNSETNPATIAPISATDLWDKAVANKVEALGKAGGNPVIGIDLNTGLIRPANQGLATGSYLELVKLPVLTRDSEANNSPLADLFKNVEGVVKIDNWDDSMDWFHPADLLLDNVNSVKRIGQGIRLAAYCKVLTPLTRYLKTLSENPFDSEYYTSFPTAVFVLDYVWNGTDWEFSFIDTRHTPTQELPNLTENWDRNSVDSLGNRIARHYIWINNLSYTDIITEDNVGNMPKHLVDTLSGLKTIAKREDGELLGSAMDFLDVKLDETLDDRLNVGTIKNKSKIFDTSYGHFEVTPKTLTPAEAAKWGYNMLSPTPYVFECLNTPASEPQLTGVLLMRNGQPLLKPVINTPGTLYIYFNAAFDVFAAPPTNGDGYQLTIEYKNIYDEWRTLKEFSTTETHSLFNAGKFIEIPFSSPDETVLIRATITNRNETVNVALSDGTTENHYVVSSQLITTLSYTKDPSQSNVSPKIYDIGSALGMTYWKGRLVAWGVLNAESTLFLSEPNEPEYFAYPNGIDLFEENIVHVIPYSDALIVFTSTKLWRLDMLTDGLSWSKTLLQQNLRIIDKDIPYITVLKNMLFFKSDKQFYMLVPARSGTVGELTIAPISKAIQDFLTKPFDNLRDVLRVTYPEMCSDNPINNYLVKYGAHSEQSKIFVDWWFDLTAWKNGAEHIGDSQVDHDVLKIDDNDDNPSLLEKEYWLVQLVYDVQTYSWSIRTHASPAVGVFVTDAANIDTDFVSLVFSPEPTINDSPIFIDTSGVRYAKATWGVSIAHRRTTNDSLLQSFTLGDEDSITLIPEYPRFQVFDTGYKEVSAPALKKHFREIQFTFEPRRAVQTESDGDAVGIKAVLSAQIDGHTVLPAVSQEITEELQEDGTLIIKVVDQINYQDIQLSTPSTVPLPYLMDSELSNTFVLGSSALSGVKNVKVRRAINGKGHLIRMRFTNITESNYAITSHAFVSHNKNAR